MTEAEWLASEHPGPMLRFAYPTLSGRKRRLLAAARARAVWGLLIDRRSRAAAEVAERHADGVADDDALAAARAGAEAAQYEIWQRRAEPDAGESPEWTASLYALWATEGLSDEPDGDDPPDKDPLSRLGISFAEQAALVRDIVRHPAARGGHLGKLGEDAERLARHAYESRDWAALAVLADALEDEGCTDAALLSHLRSPGPHMRGCWALDLVLGKD